MRCDLLLSRLCLLKTRSQAGKACDEGRVRINGHPAKASSEVRPGDRVVWADALGRFEEEVEVIALPEGSVSRAAARELYRRVERRVFDRPGGASDPDAAGEGR
jgi:ribosomal 50S subunit-recycling heat shock protein